MGLRHYSQRRHGFTMTKSEGLIRNRYQKFVKRPESFRSLVFLSADKRKKPLSD